MADKDDSLENAGNSPLIPIRDIDQDDSFSGDANPYLSRLDSAFEEGTLHVFYKREKKYLEARLSEDPGLDRKSVRHLKDRLHKLMSAYNYVCQIHRIKPYNPENKKLIPIVEVKEQKSAPAIDDSPHTEPEPEIILPPADIPHPVSFWGIFIKTVLPFLLLAVIALAYRELNTIKVYEERLSNYSETSTDLIEEDDSVTEYVRQNDDPVAVSQNESIVEPPAKIEKVPETRETITVPARNEQKQLPPQPLGHREISIMPHPPHHHTPLAIRQGLRKAHIVEFGNYPQTVKGEKKPIQWLVISQHPSGEALLLSRYALEAAPFNLDNVPVSWEKSSIRKWLNKEFISSSFTKDEQGQIIYSNVDNSSVRQYFSHSAAIYWTNLLGRNFKDLAGKEWKTTDNPNTRDRVFLLSLNEAAKLVFPYMLLKPTEYALTEQGGRVKTISPKCDSSGKNCKTTPETGTTGWWLRSPGIDRNFSAMVFGGRIFAIGTKADYAGNAVRPAIRVKNIYNSTFAIIE